jgi:hypothetical protein
MMKKITALALISFFMLAGISAIAQEIAVIKPSDFPDQAEQYMGQKIQIEGMVVHVCKHGGKKMFIVGDDPDVRVKIDASDEVSVFKTELEGSTVMVQGIVEPMDQDPIPEEEQHDEDEDHTNHYHKKQYSISCSVMKVLD